jgi:hypothetical protein
MLSLMAKIAYILLCHKAPGAVIAQAQLLSASGGRVVIHYDASAPKQDYKIIRAALKDNPAIAFTAQRLRCGWGQWSLVQATLLGAEMGLCAFPEATHFYLVSGDCAPIKPARHIEERLAREELDYIECYDYFTSDWIKTGWRDERVIYRHWFNERSQRRLFYASYWVQKRLGLKRALPDLNLRIGSQWWCLRRKTVEYVLSFLRKRKDIRHFFASTWIPDETMFQTLVWHGIPEAEISQRSPTFFAFSDYGLPASFYDDHVDFLLRQDNFFARKISPQAEQLRQELKRQFASGVLKSPPIRDGAFLYQTLTGQGRIGARFAPRAWDMGGSIGAERRLFVLACNSKKLANQRAQEVVKLLQCPLLGHVFSDSAEELPNLGGIEQTLGQRLQHRRAFLRLVFDQLSTDTLVICVTPKDLEFLKDFETDPVSLYILHVQNTLANDELQAQTIKRFGSGAQPALNALHLEAVHADATLSQAEFSNILTICNETDFLSAVTGWLSSKI